MRAPSRTLASLSILLGLGLHRGLGIIVLSRSIRIGHTLFLDPIPSNQLLCFLSYPKLDLHTSENLALVPLLVSLDHLG
jgi:hypothetical protein